MELYLTEKDRRKLGVSLPVLEKVLEGYEMKKMMQDLMQEGKLNVNTLNRTVNVTLGKKMAPVKGGKKGHRASRDKMIVPVIRLFMNKEIMENIEKQIPNLPYPTSAGVVVRGGKRKSSRRRSTKRKSSRRKSSRRKIIKKKSSRRRSTRRNHQDVDHQSEIIDITKYLMYY